MFGKKKVINRQIVGFTKARKILFFTIKPKPIYKEEVAAPSQPAVQAKPGAVAQGAAQQNAAQAAKPAAASSATRTAARHPELESSLVELGMRMTPVAFINQCTKRAAIVALVAAVIAAFVLLYTNIIPIAVSLLLVLVIGLGGYMATYGALFNYPMRKTRAIGKDVERDILFAARDMIVSMRSGLPLFNAMATVSVGYGSSSKEFEKIIDRVQLGMPMEQAIEEVSAKSQSKTFKRLMLQASTSIRVGADVITSIQEVINDASQERVIELRRYGQKLNAIAMFYMLFGIIFPSMGLAVAAIMSTFISFIPVTNTTLLFAAAALVVLQVIFLNLVTSSRPSFTT